MADEHTAVRRELAARIGGAFTERAGAVAVLLVGSAATGRCDGRSDLDLVLFYETWPAPSVLVDVRIALGGTDTVVLGGDVDGDVYLEQFRLDGVACQCVHQTLAAWRATAATVLVDLDTTSPTQKALSGLHAGLVLSGEDVVASVRAEAAYPEALREAMVRDHLDVVPLWRMQDALVDRDAELWQRAELVAGLRKLLAMLAGVHRTYFSAFQLKHTRELVASFGSAPPSFVDRLEEALVAPMPEAAAALRSLVDETLAIVAVEVPAVDVSPLRRYLA